MSSSLILRSPILCPLVIALQENHDGESSFLQEQSIVIFVANLQTTTHTVKPTLCRIWYAISDTGFHGLYVWSGRKEKAEKPPSTPGLSPTERVTAQTIRP